MQFESVGDVSLEQKWKSVPAPTTALENSSGCFDCNICLESANDPVVTLCGHLYCRPCIYKWLNVQSSSPEPGAQPNCPVCKAIISKSSLVPLYGQGTCQSESNAKRPQLNLNIPRRPPALGVNTPSHQQLNPYPFQPRQPSFQQQQYFPHPVGTPNFVATAMTSPTVGMFGEMVYASIFGSSDTRLLSPPPQYPLMRNGGPRVRRQELQVDKSLNRVSIFLFCCLILCLLLF